MIKPDELERLLDVLRAKGEYRAFSDGMIRVEFGEEPPLRLPLAQNTTSPADLARLDAEMAREFEQEKTRPKDALALALTAGNDHGRS